MVPLSYLTKRLLKPKFISITILSCHFLYLDEPLELFIVVSTVSGYYSLGCNQYRNW